MATTRAMIPATAKLLEFVGFFEFVGFVGSFEFVEFAGLPLLIKIDDHFEKMRRRVRMPKRGIWRRL